DVAEVDGTPVTASALDHDAEESDRAHAYHRSTDPPSGGAAREHGGGAAARVRQARQQRHGEPAHHNSDEYVMRERTDAHGRCHSGPDGSRDGAEAPEAVEPV